MFPESGVYSSRDARERVPLSYRRTEKCRVYAGMKKILNVAESPGFPDGSPLYSTMLAVSLCLRFRIPFIYRAGLFCRDAYQRLFLIASCQAFRARAKVPRNDGLSRYRRNRWSLRSSFCFISGHQQMIFRLLSFPLLPAPEGTSVLGIFFICFISTRRLQ
jgi:hypothetical protein